ncbi:MULTISPECIES: DUF1304 family protein [Brachybacterium]|uniref:DUF1304 family protein n=1 Tax=Brachybacterium rhamnosum TaxID=173361 RepID=A0ABW4Q2Q1_9MICO|nr:MULTISPECIES: DUF1304 family protein [Brachybacterium]MCW1804998.1 DUF1304 domain-containing protein [Brachybacterium squillarum]QCR54771.1 DUF1304 domain-containing protein [Brachybacterium sp. SGAir0954]
MVILGSVLALAAAALHVLIFALESLLWGTPRSQAVFGAQSPEEIETTKLMALNQGFYNLFLAVLAALGAILLLAGSTAVGGALALAGTGSMLAAALVLLLASPAHRAAAIKQGTLPLLAVLALVIGLAI